MFIFDLMNIEVIACHNGLMHSDDVISAAFLSSVFKFLNHSVTINRMDEKDASKYVNNPAYLLFDIGNGRYGYHDKKHMIYRDSGIPYAESGIPYTAFGLLWKDFGKSYLTEVFKARTGKNPSDSLVEKFFHEFDRNYVSVIDSRVNHGTRIASNISDTIAAMNGRTPCDDNFMTAVSWAQLAFDAWINSTINAMEDDQEIIKTIESLPDSVIILELEHNINLNGSVNKKCQHIRYAIYPSIWNEGCWNIAALPADGWNKITCPFIPNISLYKGISFITPNGLMAVSKSKDAAINACIQNKKLHEKKSE